MKTPYEAFRRDLGSGDSGGGGSGGCCGGADSRRRARTSNEGRKERERGEWVVVI